MQTGDGGTEYIDKERFRMHIIVRNNNPLKVKLTDEEKKKFLKVLDEVPTVTKGAME